ncbi:MAG TPA: hypothetical protein PK098_04945 [Phycisphaerales bacterium]|nr:hypothetical protein [Phycisphaerales bacterium]
MSRTYFAFCLGLIVGGVVFTTGLLLGGMGRVEPDALRIRDLEIVDELGTTLLKIGSNRDGGSISIRNRFGRTVLLAAAAEQGGAIVGNIGSTGQRAFEMGVTERGPELTITDFDRRGAVRLGFQPEGQAMIACMGPDASPRVRFTSDSKGHGLVTTYSSAGKPLAVVGSTVHGQGHFTTHGAEGRPLIALTSTVDNEGQLYTYNAAGLPMIALATHTTGPSLRIFNRHGEAIISLESGDDDQGEVGVWQRDGTGRVIQP